MKEIEHRFSRVEFHITRGTGASNVLQLKGPILSVIARALVSVERPLVVSGRRSDSHDVGHVRHIQPDRGAGGERYV